MQQEHQAKAVDPMEAAVKDHIRLRENLERVKRDLATAQEQLAAAAEREDELQRNLDEAKMGHDSLVMERDKFSEDLTLANTAWIKCDEELKLVTAERDQLRVEHDGLHRANAKLLSKVDQLEADLARTRSEGSHYQRRAVETVETLSLVQDLIAREVKRDAHGQLRPDATRMPFSAIFEKPETIPQFLQQGPAHQDPGTHHNTLSPGPDAAGGPAETPVDAAVRAVEDALAQRPTERRNTVLGT